jgi:hypothetical protein
VGEIHTTRPTPQEQEQNTTPAAHAKAEEQKSQNRCDSCRTREAVRSLTHTARGFTTKICAACLIARSDELLDEGYSLVEGAAR